MVDLNRLDEAKPILEEILLLEANAKDAPPAVEQLAAHHDHAKGLLAITLQETDPDRALTLLNDAVQGLAGRTVYLQNAHVRDPLIRHVDALIALHEANGDSEKVKAVRSKLSEYEKNQAVEIEMATSGG